jgi:hypothetical protein
VVALAGFGLDSLIEIVASTIVVWQIKGVDRNRERPALRLISGAFFLLAVYVLVQAAYTFASGIHPAPSRPGTIRFHRLETSCRSDQIRPMRSRTTRTIRMMPMIPTPP